ncbi:MAG: TonB C-terminal domain-containing protein [Parasphingorhabdus sp.]
MKTFDWLFSSAVQRSRLPAALALSIIIAITITALGAPDALFAQSTATLGERHYDIPEQPVAQALARFATVSGVNIIYRQSLTGNRRSAPVSDRLTAPVALRRLLEGTGLSARFTSPESVIIYVEGQSQPSSPSPQGTTADLTSLQLGMAEVRAAPIIGGPDRNAFNHYAQRIRIEILERLRRDGAYEGRRFRIEIAVTVNPEGRITHVTFLRPSDESAWDRRVEKILVGALLSAPPPEGLTRSMRFEVETDRLAEQFAKMAERQDNEHPAR